MPAIRPAAVAGSFYPGEAAALAAEVAAYLAEAAPSARGTRAPKAIIAPHAGYMYSGADRRVDLRAPGAAARARASAWCSRAPRIASTCAARRFPSAQAFASPLGDGASSTREALAALRALPFVEVSDRAHALEHSLEVHLPFLQAVLGEFRARAARGRRRLARGDGARSSTRSGAATRRSSW